MEEHFLIKVLHWGSRKSNCFTYGELMKALSFENWEKQFLDRNFRNAKDNFVRDQSFRYSPVETIFFVIQQGGSDFKDDHFRYTLTSDALFKYIDYEELQFARRHAEEAKKFSWRAIWISVGAIVVSVLVPILITQTIKIQEKQFESIFPRIYPLDSAPPPLR